MLVTNLAKSVIRSGTLRLIDARERLHEFGDGSGRPVTVRLHDRALHHRLFLNPELHLGEAYMNGTLTVEDGDIYDLLDLGLLWVALRGGTAREALAIRLAGIQGGIECAKLAPQLSALADGEVFAVEPLHDVVGTRVSRQGTDRQHRHDVRVIQSGRGKGFLTETTDAVFVFGDVLGKKFERDLAIQARIFSQINIAHSTLADLFDNFVMPKTSSAFKFCCVDYNQIRDFGDGRRFHKTLRLGER